MKRPWMILSVLGLCLAGCSAPKASSELELVKNQVAFSTLVLRISEVNWREPSDREAILDELLEPIKDDPESLANLCLFVTELHAREGGPSERNHSFFLECLVWRAAQAICTSDAENAYHEFKRLQPIIGRDGGGALLFNELEERYFPREGQNQDN